MTKTRDSNALNIVFSFGGGKGQPWARILNCVLSSCVKPIKTLAQIFFILTYIGAMSVLPRIPPLSFLQWKCERMNTMAMFLPGGNFALIFKLAINDSF